MILNYLKYLITWTTGVLINSNGQPANGRDTSSCAELVQPNSNQC